MSGTAVRGCLLALLTMGAPAGLAAQIPAALEEISDATVRMEYALRDGYEVCTYGIRNDSQRMQWWSRDGDTRPNECDADWVQVEVSVRSGRVTDVEIVRPLRERTEGATDVGRVDAADAARYLLGLARAGATDSAAKDGIFAAALADVPEIWRDLLAIARDRRVDGEVRERALFWLGQEAAESVTPELEEIAVDDGEQSVRDAAVFALSQRDPSEAIPALISVAEDAPQADTRRRAMFWLAQIEDERVVDYFERVLRGGIR